MLELSDQAARPNPYHAHEPTLSDRVAQVAVIDRSRCFSELTKGHDAGGILADLFLLGMALLTLTMMGRSPGAPGRP